MKQKKIGLIGAGNIAYAIVCGIVKSGYITPEQIMLFDTRAESYEKFLPLGVRVAESAEELVAFCDVLFLTVKPQVCPTVMQQISALVRSQQCLVSVCAGIPISFYREILGADAKIIRVMPNTPLLIGEGASALVFQPPVTQEEFDFVRGIFAASGTTRVVEESLISAVTAVSGSGPAYFFRMAEVVCDWAREQGMSEETALDLFCHTMIGAAGMMLRREQTPAKLREAVTSPNGTTQAALEAFDASGWDDGLRNGLGACLRRSEELSGTK